jgi:hypothetical protein
MSDIGVVDRVPARPRARFALCLIAGVLFAVALVSDVVLAVVQPTCPPGWTSFNLGPGVALILAIPVTLLLVVSIVAAVRARRPRRTLTGGFPVATSLSALLALLATGTAFLILASALDQLINPNAGCITF